MSQQPKPRRVGELTARRGVGWTVHAAGDHDPYLDRARGMLLGLVIAEQQRAQSAGAQLTALAETTLAIAELCADSDHPHPGEVARTIIDHALPDPRYDEDLLALLAVWQRGVPVQIAASHLNVPEGVATDFAAVVLSPLAIRHVDDQTMLRERVAAYAGITHAHAVGVDGAVVQATAVAAALRGDDPLNAGSAAAAALQLRDRLQAVAVLREQRTRPGSLREHFDTSPDAADAVATAIFCATTAAGFAGALHKARCASGPLNAVQALTGAIAGARVGAGAIPSRLLTSVPPGARARALRAAAALLDAPDATLT